MENAHPLIDLNRIREIGGLENPDVRRILRRFIAELPHYREQMEKAWAEGNLIKLSATLHRLKGAARSCGFFALGQASGAWLNRRDGDVTDVQQQLEETLRASIIEWERIAGND
jgi:HPt (histidine-containing phosphotransfer) domain-containing protein